MELFRGDCDHLQRKGLLSSAQRREWESAFAADDSKREPVRLQQRKIFHDEIHTIIEQVRIQQNRMHEQTLQSSDLVAVTAGAVLGALNAWMRPAPAPSASASSTTAAGSKATTVWASAFDAAQASLNVSRQRRLLDHLRIEHISGDASTAGDVLLCINGFMTQGRDPSRNWGVWADRNPNSVLYAVQWEAGDEKAWDEFCAHANENIKASGMAAHDLLTHFTGNPWHKAQDKAEQVGILLAQVLAAKPAFCRGRSVTVLGHSLGGAVIYAALKELARLRTHGQLDGHPLIHNAIILAGAFTFDAHGISCMRHETKEKFINVYSRRDEVLNKLFWAIQFHTDDPIAAGCAPIDFGNATGAQGVNIDASALIAPTPQNQFGHSYGPYMESIRARVQPHLTMATS